MKKCHKKWQTSKTEPWICEKKVTKSHILLKKVKKVTNYCKKDTNLWQKFQERVQLVKKSDKLVRKISKTCAKKSQM